MINSVRNTVLAVLNKNNYGYISPQDYNLYSKQAQLELFEEYFDRYNKAINAENARLSGVDYADIVKPIAEVMESFLMRSNLLNGLQGSIGVADNNFFVPSLNTTGDQSFKINTILTYPIVQKRGVSSTVGVSSQLIDLSANFIQSGVKVGDIVVNLTFINTPLPSAVYALQVTVTSIVSATVLELSADMFASTTGQDYVIISAESGVEAEKVLDSKIFMLNRSNLTAPSNMLPSYVLSNSSEFNYNPQGIPRIKMYPETINTYGQVVCTYFRYPKDPKWTYITLFNGEPTFDQSQTDYQDFELPNEHEPKLAMKILQYCGVSIREIETAQFAIAQEQQAKTTFTPQ